MQRNNRPYDLTTSHGRAQSTAHSAHGAFLANVVEQAIEDALNKDALAEQIGEMIIDEWNGLNPVDHTDRELLDEFKVFHAELGVRDAEQFKPLLKALEERHSALEGNMIILTKVITKIEEALGLDITEE